MDETLHRHLLFASTLLAALLGAVLGVAYLAWGLRVWIPAVGAFWFGFVVWAALGRRDDSGSADPAPE